jgi:hypothetical protein
MNPFLGARASSTETSNTTSSLSLSPQTPPRWITSTHAPPPHSGLLLPPPAFTRGPQALGYPHDRPPLPPLLLAPHQTAPTPLTHESLMATAAAHLYSHAHRHSDHFDHQQSPLRPQLPFAAPPARCPHPQPWPLTNSPTAGGAPPRPQEASPQHKYASPPKPAFPSAPQVDFVEHRLLVELVNRATRARLLARTCFLES